MKHFEQRQTVYYRDIEYSVIKVHSYCVTILGDGGVMVYIPYYKTNLLLTEQEYKMQNNRPELEKSIEKMEQELANMKEQLKNSVEYYEVETPISEATTIIWDNFQQTMYTTRQGGLVVRAYCQPLADYRKNYVWVPCKREDLKAGDIGYGRDSSDEDFNVLRNVLAIVDEDEVYHIESDEDIEKILISSCV